MISGASREGVLSGNHPRFLIPEPKPSNRIRQEYIASMHWKETSYSAGQLIKKTVKERVCPGVQLYICNGQVIVRGPRERLTLIWHIPDIKFVVRRCLVRPQQSVPILRAQTNIPGSTSRSPAYRHLRTFRCRQGTLL